MYITRILNKQKKMKTKIFNVRKIELKTPIKIMTHREYDELVNSIIEMGYLNVNW